MVRAQLRQHHGQITAYTLWLPKRGTKFEFAISKSFPTEMCPLVCLQLPKLFNLHMRILGISKAFLMDKSVTYFIVSWAAFSNLMSPDLLGYNLCYHQQSHVGWERVNCSTHLEGTRIGVACCRTMFRVDSAGCTT